ncbi:hypothetical protein HYALB_00002860 [Hymenoscyphus albidus]|uniref:Protein kinase domain-containing protein n=1 Tax=Hymenoscyphus albidus TaxID=595503 RepID=A0A9N9LE50_9HELO|nr:hypothetical protein HYALB_00002860 [Hymenoscyphus albidus]
MARSPALKGSLAPQLQSIFARLIPANVEAQRLFSTLADHVLSDATDSAITHAAKFMHIEPYSPPETTLDRDMRQESQTSTDTDDEISVVSSPNYHGHYILSFETNPLTPNIGHTSRTPQDSSIHFGVAGIHATICFDDDGVLTLKTLTERRGFMTILGNDEFTKGRRTITERKSCVSFGSLSYYLEYSGLEDEEYNHALRTYMQDYLMQDAPCPDISATPSPMDTLVGDWNIRGTVGSGSFGVVNATKNIRTGKTGAAKCLVQNSIATHSKILQEIVTLKAIPQNPRLLHYCTEYYERGERWYTGILDELDERYSLRTRPEKVIIIYGPFVRFNLSEELVLKQPFNIRIAAFYQVLQGLVSLHSGGFIHSDIKPSNIGVVKQSADMINVVILDYGETIHAQRCEPHPGKTGTIPFLAPEMEQCPYGKEVDLWATGIVGIQLFMSGEKVPWDNVVRAKTAWRKQVEDLQSAPVRVETHDGGSGHALAKH